MSKPLTRQALAAGLKEAARIRNGFVPGEAELANAPVLSSWAVDLLPGGMVRLVGMVSGHPTVPDGWCATSVVLAADEEAGWVRTISRYYRLGAQLGQTKQ